MKQEIFVEKTKNIKQIFLALESSCDDTCASVVCNDNGKICVLSNIVSSQTDIHTLYGGVVPEIASRNHALAILPVVTESLKVAGLTIDDVTNVCATTHPGLRGAVMVGDIFGRSFANARNLPFTAVNHLHGHIASVAINKDIKPPFLSLVVSGGHTAIYSVKKWGAISLVMQTMDDAVGEAFDKVAKLLGLGLPGGVHIERLAKEYTGELITFVKHPRADGFTYSGLKTAVMNYTNKIDVPKICASFQHEAVMQLVSRTIEEMKKSGQRKLAVSGGVSANGYLRDLMSKAVAEIGGTVFFPEQKYCTDNAAMIGAAAILGLKFVD
ncbi:MAG: tRNA (adenosine(37)-N6)-threonylcarbamoyltransferase complex transferase subunit TsaD [Firmicutes bacterium]|nr:tRNA (adenosine(37)-N6)-threonylcarbamoyltransferase complex transferase subunit TsaD [Bacillota bacterium]